MTNPIIEARDLTLKIGDKEIFSDISFQVDAGSYLAIVGPNGAGKTSLLKCLVRILRATKGDVSILGRSLRSYSQRQLAEILSYVPQGEQDLRAFSVHDFVMLGRYTRMGLLGSTSSKDREAVKDALGRTGMLEFESRLMSSLSGGEYQKVMIAASLAQEPQVLLLDEPTAFLDYRHHDEVLELMAQLNQEHGVTIIAVTHDLNDALRSSQVLAMREGRVVFSGEPEGLLHNTTLEAIYAKRFTFVDHPQSGAKVVLREEPSRGGASQ